MQYKAIATIFSVVAFLAGNVTAIEYIVKVKNPADFQQVVASIEKQMGVKIQAKDRHLVGGLAKINIGSSLTKGITTRRYTTLSSRKDIQYMVPNIRLHTLEVRSNDTRLQEQWALKQVRAFEAWDTATGSQKVKVAVIDTGADPEHEDLKANLIEGYDFFDNDETPTDETSADGNPGHGTHCSGVIGAVGNNNKGISGINQNISIMPIRFLGADGSGDLFNSVKAIDYAIEHGANVISASWGAPITKSDAQPIIDAIDRAGQKGILFVTAAGNDGTSNDTVANYPANAGLANVIDVAASDELDKRPYWSNFGKYTVDIAAPGVKILSTLPKNEYDHLDGTSMATPLVAGIAGLMLSKDATLTPAQLKSILQSSGKAVNIESSCNCRVDAASALDIVIHQKLTVVPAAGHVEIGANVQMGAFGGTAPFTFSSSDPDIASVSDDGKLTGVKEGEVQVEVTDSKGNKASSLKFLVGAAPKESLDCPYKDEYMCQLFCMIDPSKPWCDKNSDGGDGDNDGGDTDGENHMTPVH